MSDLRRVLLVVNPKSRRGVRHRAAALRAFARAGVSVQEVVTEHPGHARDVLNARAEPWDAVFVLGGDGTVMEVVGALAHSGTPVGVLPGGTGNLVAGVLGIPLGIRKAVNSLLTGELCSYDLGQLPDGRYFAYAAGVGADVAMVERTSHGRKRALGIVSYAITAARAAFGRELVHVTIDVDGKRIDAKAVLAMIANAGTFLGGRFAIGPDVKPDDGELDLCLFMPERWRDVVVLFWRVLRKDFRPHPLMTFARGRVFRISADPPVAVQADGDIVGRTPIEITVAPGAARFLKPRASTMPGKPA
ncbi:MAG TPA: diacylglycerol kinase family protein [Gemmatimonadaceae bacterium]